MSDIYTDIAVLGRLCKTRKHVAALARVHAVLIQVENAGPDFEAIRDGAVVVCNSTTLGETQSQFVERQRKAQRVSDALRATAARNPWYSEPLERMHAKRLRARERAAARRAR